MGKLETVIEYCTRLSDLIGVLKLLGFDVHIDVDDKGPIIVIGKRIW